PTCSDPGGTPGEEVGCCSELAHEAFPEGVVPDPASVAPEVKACCGVLAAHYDALLASVGGSGGAVADPWNWNADGDVKWSCCASIEWASTTCTPWGPPVPPAMPPGRLRLARLEVA
ncbi:MAG: hypothetical protein IT373_03775, partial [Polyangiaceae bacterium]|nr:hypothetical protein [Polyangiaceae bacterium]